MDKKIKLSLPEEVQILLEIQAEQEGISVEEMAKKLLEELLEDHSEEVHETPNTKH